MSSATAITYTEHVSGPSPLVAILRAVYLKVTGVMHSAWSTARIVLTAALRVPGTVAATVTSVLSSKAGYSAVTSGLRGFLRGVWNGITRCARFLGRLFNRTGKGLVTLVGHVSPAAADLLYAVLTRVSATVTHAAQRIDSIVRTAGEVLWMLVNTAMVGTVSTAAAGVAAALMMIHEATSGAIAKWLIQQVPALVTVVGWVTNPWASLLLVALSTLGAIGLALIRLLSAGEPGPEPTDDNGPEDPAGAEDWTRWQASIDQEALDSLVHGLHVSVAPDGSVSVSGIPEWVPENMRNHVAKVAANAALKQWERTIRTRPTPSRDDRRLFTKAARDAVRRQAAGMSESHPHAA